MGIGLSNSLVGQIQQEFPRSLSKKGAIEFNFQRMKFTFNGKESKKCPTTMRTPGKPCNDHVVLPLFALIMPFVCWQLIIFEKIFFWRRGKQIDGIGGRHYSELTTRQLLWQIVIMLVKPFSNSKAGALSVVQVVFDIAHLCAPKMHISRDMFGFTYGLMLACVTQVN